MVVSSGQKGREMMLISATKNYFCKKEAKVANVGQQIENWRGGWKLFQKSFESSNQVLKKKFDTLPNQRVQMWQIEGLCCAIFAKQIKL